jgi:hypothetical protein
MESNQLGSQMILPDFILPSRIHQQWDYSGMDSIELCLDKKHFLSYPHKVHYSYNSRGFRDEEWPDSIDELKNAVWCVGDSFTVGVGQPFGHTWPQVLSQRLGRRTINVSMDGASNEWIARKVQRIVEIVNPKNIAIMWSYTHRRELDNAQLDDEQRRILSSRDSINNDYLNWANLLANIKFYNTKIVQLTIPDFHHPAFDHTTTTYSSENTWDDIKDNSWPPCPKNIQDFKNLPVYIVDELKNLHGCYDEIKTQLEFHDKLKSVPIDNTIYIKKRLDWARDYHHFDILTAQWVVDQIYNQFFD